MTAEILTDVRVGVAPDSHGVPLGELEAEITAGATTGKLKSSPGAVYEGGNFRINLQPGTASEEIIICSLAGANLTFVERGADGTTAQAHVASTTAYNVGTAGGFNKWLEQRSGSFLGNVLRYGADAKGVEDATAAFKKAGEESNTIYAPAGTYLIAGELELKGKVLRGDGPEATILKKATAATGMLTITSGNGEIRDLTIENTVATTAEFEGTVVAAKLTEVAEVTLTTPWASHGLEVNSEIVDEGGVFATGTLVESINEAGKSFKVTKAASAEHAKEKVKAVGPTSGSSVKANTSTAGPPTVIQNVYVTNAFTGFEVTGSAAVTIINPTVRGWTAQGLFIHEGPSVVEIIGGLLVNEVPGKTPKYSGSAVELKGSVAGLQAATLSTIYGEKSLNSVEGGGLGPSESFFTGCFFDSARPGEGKAASELAAGSDLKFQGCWFEANTTGSAFKITNSAVTECAFTGCEFRSAPEHGCIVHEGAQHVWLGCHFFGNSGKEAEKFDGLHLEKVFEFQVIGCRSDGSNQQWGYNINSTCLDFLVIGNTGVSNLKGLLNDATATTRKIVRANLTPAVAPKGNSEKQLEITIAKSETPSKELHSRVTLWGEIEKEKEGTIKIETSTGGVVAELTALKQAAAYKMLLGTYDVLPNATYKVPAVAGVLLKVFASTATLNG